VSNPDEKTVIAEGRYIRLVKRGRWEFVERTNASDVVVIVAITDDREIVLVEQFRPPLSTRVIELPAGLVGDVVSDFDEEPAEAARRELLEETGYEAKTLEPIFSGPPSAGLSSELVTFYRATGLRNVDSGGGDETEEIQVHVVKLGNIDAWLARRREFGALIDPKVFAGIYFAA
jgi:ADP-ribose pyrophosphatase